MTRRLGVHLGIVGGAVVAGQLFAMAHNRSFGLGEVPYPVQALALASGCFNALFAVGLVLVYRASRVINFSQAGVGGVGAVVMLLLIRERDVPYFLAVAAGIATAVALGLLVELLFVRRFFKAPRLVLTVATLGIAQVLLWVAQILPAWFATPGEEAQVFGRFESPLSGFRVDWFPVVFTGDHAFLVVVTLAGMAVMGAFLRRSSLGIAVRAAAENDDKAALLGINVRTLSSVVWGLAALLSGIAAVLQVPVSGVSSAAVAGVGSAVLLRGLAAAVIARMDNLALAVTAALAISVFEQSVFFVVGRTDVVDLVILLVILGGLLVQRRGIARAEHTGAATWAATEEIPPVPRQLAHLPAVRRGARWLRVAGAVVVLGYPWIASPAQTNLGGLFAVYGIVAVSMVILIGWGGQVSLGQFAFVAVGAMVGGACTSKLDLWFPLATLLASLVGAGVAVVLGLPALRIKGLFLAVTTLAFSVVTMTVLLNPRYFGWLLPGTVERPRFAFVDTEDERSFYYLCILALLFSVFVAKGLRNSRTGRVLIAVRDNERAAQALGVNLVRTRLATFALSGFLASFAGVFYAHHQHSVTQQAFSPEMSISMFVMAVIGGLGSVTGVLLGPLYIGLTEVWLPARFQLLAGAVGVLLVLLFVPGGLGSVAFRLRDAYLRRVAIRHRIFVPSLLADYRIDVRMAKVPLAPLVDADGSPVTPPVRYRLPSRIGLAGASQHVRRWSF